MFRAERTSIIVDKKNRMPFPDIERIELQKYMPAHRITSYYLVNSPTEADEVNITDVNYVRTRIIWFYAYFSSNGGNVFEISLLTETFAE